MLLLIFSMLVGAAAGGGGFYLWRTVAPSYIASARFECVVPTTDAETGTGVSTRIDSDEFERFMLTQVSIMTSPDVLELVVNDPRLRRNAPAWASEFEVGGRFDAPKAMEDLEDRVSARVIRGTTLIELAAHFGVKDDVRAIVQITRESYRTLLQRQLGGLQEEVRQGFRGQIAESEAELAALEGEIARRIRDNNIDSIETRVGENRIAQETVISDLAQVRLEIETIESDRANYDEQLLAPGGISFPDDLVAEANLRPLVQAQRSQINQLETQLEARRLRLGENHREVRALRTELTSARSKLEEIREQELTDLFQGLVETTDRALDAARAREQDLLDRREELAERANDLTLIQSEIETLERQVAQKVATLDTQRSALDEVVLVQNLGAAERVILRQRERTPDRVSRPPALPIMIAAGTLLILGLTASLAVLREVVDQRVRSAADIGMIPRVRLMGVVPDADEDPTKIKSVETVVRDHPDSVMSESFRQLRSPLVKRMEEAGHRSLVVVSAMPRSGGTTIAANTAMSFAMGERKTLLIDANLRRPKMATIFGQPEVPGLSDVLAGETSLEDAVVDSGVNGLSLLSAGSPELRIYERLGTASMAELLQKAKTSYDMVVIDTAPAVVAGDAQSIGSRADATLLVVRALNEKRGMVARLSREYGELSSDFLGVVINGVRAAAGGYLARNIRAQHAYQRGKR